MQQKQKNAPASTYEIETLQGVVPWLRSELAAAGLRVLATHDDGVRVGAAGTGVGGRRLLHLRMASAVYRREAFAVPRPKALLGDEHFRRLCGAIESVRETARAAKGEDFQGFRLAAAGKDSAVFQRLAQSLAEASGMTHDPEGGELLLRVRSDPHQQGWEVLIRLSPRPLSARPWRVCNRPGGLNATLAAVMNEVAGVGERDRYLNLMCGSGTLLVERALAGRARRIVGLDRDAAAVECSRLNLEAAGVAKLCELVQGDATAALELDGPFDVLTADLPWGDAVGSHADNATSYPELLASAASVAAPNARFAVLTHEIRLFRSVLDDQAAWRVEVDQQVGHGGHFPRLYLLRPVGGRHQPS